MKNGEQPAFAQIQTDVHFDGKSGVGHFPYVTGTGGLTKREYFAAMAMQGICAKQAEDKYHVNDGWLHPETVAKNAIHIADELLKALES